LEFWWRLLGSWPYGLMWWGRFFNRRWTSFGLSFRVSTSLWSCQPTYNMLDGPLSHCQKLPLKPLLFTKYIFNFIDQWTSII
jgi:hypothetical protein